MLLLKMMLLRMVTPLSALVVNDKLLFVPVLKGLVWTFSHTALVVASLKNTHGAGYNSRILLDASNNENNSNNNSQNTTNNTPVRWFCDSDVL